MKEEFGFEISEDEGELTVSLPHSCDEWIISWGNKEQSIAGLEAFIKEAQETLEKLKLFEPDTKE